MAPVLNWGPTLGGHRQEVGDTRPCLPCVSPPSRAAAAVIRAGGKGRTLVAMGVPLSPLQRPRRGHGGGSPAWFEDCDLQVPWGGGRGGLCSSARICWEVDPGSWILAACTYRGAALPKCGENDADSAALRSPLSSLTHVGVNRPWTSLSFLAFYFQRQAAQMATFGQNREAFQSRLSHQGSARPSPRNPS